MNIGIIASSNGSVFKELYNSLVSIYPNSFKFFVLLDRDSTLIDFCVQEKIKYKVIKETDNTQFSKIADEYFKTKNVRYIFLFFLRLVTKELYNSYQLFNLHPSLLPEYKGFNAIEKALTDRHGYLGATLHRVDKKVDGGEILIQIKTKIDVNIELERACKISYLQKVFLMFSVFERLMMNDLNEDFKKMSLSESSKLYQKILCIQGRENCWILDD